MPALQQLRHNQGLRPQIIFTSDFHELVRGDLIPGTCVLKYDPLRLIEVGDAAQETHHIRAYVRFHPNGSEWQGVMTLPSGEPLAALADPSGQGYMLSVSFDIPKGCDELEIWFSCTHEDGQTHWDSANGKNYWLRFGLADILIEDAKIKSSRKKADPTDTFELSITTDPGVDSVELRWWMTNHPDTPRKSVSLVASGSNADRKKWTCPEAGISVAKGAVVAYDLVYYLHGRKHTDDNQGSWYIASSK